MIVYHDDYISIFYRYLETLYIQILEALFVKIKEKSSQTIYDQVMTMNNSCQDCNKKVCLSEVPCSQFQYDLKNDKDRGKL